MSTIKNFSGEPLQIQLLNGKILDLPAEKCPIKLKSKQPYREIISIDVGTKSFDLVIEGNTIAIEGSSGFPAIKSGVCYIVTDEMANVLRKAHRGTSDLFIPIKTSSGFYTLRRANDITKFDDEDEDTRDFVHETWENVIKALKYDENHDDDAPFSSDR